MWIQWITISFVQYFDIILNYSHSWIICASYILIYTNEHHCFHINTYCSSKRTSDSRRNTFVYKNPGSQRWDWNLINEIRTYSAWTLSLCLCFFYSSNTGKHKNIKENFELHIMKYILEPILYAVWPKETRVWRTTLEQSFIKVQKS